MVDFFCDSKHFVDHWRMKWWMAATAILWSNPAAVLAGDGRADGNRPYNVVLICVDDLRAELGCYGDRHVISPNIDRLARAGRLFERHYVHAAICGPSRCTMLTGRRVDWSWDLPAWAEHRRTKVEPVASETIAHHFRRQGYTTVCLGKISHYPGGVLDREQLFQQMPFSWDRAYAPVGPWKTPWYAFFSYSGGRFREYGYSENDHSMPPLESADVDDNGYADGLNAEAAVQELHRLAADDAPFFLAVGFYKPHLPHNAPLRYYDQYAAAVPGPASFAPPKHVDASVCLHDSEELTSHYAWPPGRGVVRPEDVMRHRKAYYACVTYVDAQIGKVLAAMDDLQLADRTIVALWSDHGWHLGEQGVMSKVTCYEVATRSPLILRVPSMLSPGTPSRALVETVDLYPTLVDLCGLPSADGLEGLSLRPICDDPSASVRDSAISCIQLNGCSGRSVRTDRYRYVEWTELKGGAMRLAELYDHHTDPDETENLADQSVQEARRLSQLLRARFAYQQPTAAE